MAEREGRKRLARHHEELLAFEPQGLSEQGRRDLDVALLKNGIPSRAEPAFQSRRHARVARERGTYELHPYRRLSQQTLGTMEVSLLGTCTMTYNPCTSEQIAAQHYVRDLHPEQDEATLQGAFQAMDGLDRILCRLSGMDQFVFQAGDGADAAYLHALPYAGLSQRPRRGEQRREVITSIQPHSSNPATADAAGCEVITLPLGENGYPSLDALKAAVSKRTAALMINNPDDRRSVILG